MTAQVDIVNRALSALGTRTTVTAAELAGSSSNEAIQANLIYAPYRNRLLRMAPWNCGFNTASLTYITSVPGTPENTSPATSVWQKGQPVPPWAYEYQYPVDCLRACWITPQTATGFASGIPITTAVTGGAPSFWQGPPVKFRVAVDQFFPVISTTVTAPGTGYQVGDTIILNNPTPITSAPIGVLPTLIVATVGGGGALLTVTTNSQVLGEPTAVPFGGSLFGVQSGTFTQASTSSGLGTGATFTFTQIGKGDQRVILTNQEFAILNYIKLITDENVFDDDFQEAFVKILGAGLVKALTGDKSLANLMIAEANATITVARGNDGNEALAVNDVLPDWIRIRGVNFTEDYSGPYNSGFNYGSLWPGFT
jgi:hypothetical protein